MALFPLTFGETAARLISQLLFSTDNGKGASLVKIEDSGAKFTATDVEAALAEAKTLVDAHEIIKVQKRTVTLTQAADLAGLGAGVKTLTKNLGAVLPAGCRYLGCILEGFTGFQNAGDTATAGLEVGDSGGVATIFASVNVRAGQTGFPKAGTPGASGVAGRVLATGQATVKLTSDADLNTLSAGAVTVTLLYVLI